MPSTTQRWPPLLLAALVLCVAAGCGSTTDDEEIAPTRPPMPELPGLSREETQAEFGELCAGLTAGTNPFYGQAPIAELRGYVAQPVPDPFPRMIVRARLGMEMLRMGESREAVRLLEEAHRICVESRCEKDYLQDVTRRLALAWLRVGEQKNCVAMHGPASCILPIRGSGVHRDPEGARNADRWYREFLGRESDQTTVQYLLNVTAMTLGSWPDSVPEPWRIPQRRVTSDHDIGRFTDRAAEVGIRLNKPSGGGLMDDFDGDGLLDVVASTIDPCGSMNFFRNDGQGGFEDRSQEAGLDVQLGGLNIIHADFDNDGDRDIFVLRGGWFGADGKMRNSLLRNDGAAHFTDVTRAAGLDFPAYPTQAGAWADYDNDGDLDLYIGNESDLQLYSGGLADESTANYPSQLFRNNGDGTFTDVAAAAGVTNDRYAKGVAWGDYDNDGDSDLYVSNIGVNRLYRNNGDGTFTDVAAEAHVTEPEGRGFATWFFDYDNDGWLDLFVADYGARLDEVSAFFMGDDTVSTGHALLYHNEGNGSFTDVSLAMGIVEPNLPMGANYGDLDNDGWLDFYLGTGMPSYESVFPNLMYRNDAGKRFQNVTYSGGFGHLQKGHGVAFGDIDNDGDQDVFEQMGGAFPGDAYHSVLYENPGHGNSWIVLKLVGTRSNRDAIGARVRVTVTTPAGPRVIHSRVSWGGSFGGSSLLQEIGLGDASAIERVEIDWPASGTTQVFEDVPRERFFEIHEGSSKLRPLERPRIHLGSGHGSAGH